MSVLAFLQVPGLVEKRPNLIIGDVVYLRQASHKNPFLSGLYFFAWPFTYCPNLPVCALKHCTLNLHVVMCESDLMCVVLYNMHDMMLQSLNH